MNTNTIAQIAHQIMQARFTETNSADREIMNGVVSHARYSGRLEELEIILNHWISSAMGDYCNRNNDTIYQASTVSRMNDALSMDDFVAASK